MIPELLNGGRLHSPFSIFVRTPPTYSDADLLSLFALDRYRSAELINHSARAVIADAEGWVMLADDWGYTLWHMESTWSTIRSLAQRQDVFACVEGCEDRSFGYHYYAGGEPVREYPVDSPSYHDRIVRANRGEQLAGEAELLAADGIDIGLDVAAQLGIKTRFEIDGLRMYVPPGERWFARLLRGLGSKRNLRQN